MSPEQAGAATALARLLGEIADHRAAMARPEHSSHPVLAAVFSGPPG
jgi:hypothetical protein